MTATMDRPAAAVKGACVYCDKTSPADDLIETRQGVMHLGCAVDEARECDREASECPGFDLSTWGRTPRPARLVGGR